MKASTPSARSGAGLSIATLGAIVATLIVNTLSNIVPPGGENVGEIATTLLWDVKIIPASYAFAIWGVIYLGLIAYGVYQLGASQRQNPTIRQVDRLLIVACGAQILWIFLFTLKQFGWSILAMLGILIPLIGIYLQLNIGKSVVSRREQWMVQIPFSIYLAWISVATIVNVAAALYIASWTGWGLNPEQWTALMLGVSAVIGAIAALVRRDVAFTLVFVWAYVAIAVRQFNSVPILVTAVGLAIGLLILLAIGQFRRSLTS